MFQRVELVVDGIRSPVLTGGAGAHADEAVVFVHGNPGAGRDWSALMGAVAPFARVIAPDMPGFGGAEKPAQHSYSVLSYATHLAGLLDQLGAQRVHVVAHDFGGPWALTWASAHLDQVASVTLINTGVLLDYRWHRLARLWRLPVVGELVMRGATPSMVRHLLGHDNPGLGREHVAEIGAHFRPGETKRAVLRLYRSTSTASIEALSARMRSRNIPALVLWGDRDAYIPLAQAERQRRSFPRATVVVLPGIGHWAWLEAPERVADHVVPFVRSQLLAPHHPAP